MKPAQFKAARVALGYTQAAFAVVLEVDPVTIRRWEMEPNVKSARKPNKHACKWVVSMLIAKGILTPEKMVKP